MFNLNFKGEVTTLAGCHKGFADGKGLEAKFAKPQGIIFDELDQSLVVCDFGNNKLRRVSINGISPSISLSFSRHHVQEKLRQYAMSNALLV
jgi:hypothetical protein